MLVVALAASFVAGVPSAHAGPPASEEYVFEGPNASGNEGGGGPAGGDSTGAGDSSGSDAAVPILIGVLVVTAAAGAAIAIVRRQRT